MTRPNRADLSILTSVEVRRLAAYLQGTPRGGAGIVGEAVGDAWEGWDLDDLSGRTQDELFALVERCVACDHWHARGELLDLPAGFTCAQCATEGGT